MENALSIFDAQDIIQEDNRQFDRIIAELKEKNKCQNDAPPNFNTK